MQDTFLAAYHARSNAPFPFGTISKDAQWRSLETSFKPVNDKVVVQRWKELRAGETSNQRVREMPVPGLPGLVFLVALEKLLQEDTELAGHESDKAFKSLVHSKVVQEDYMMADAFYSYQQKTMQRTTKLKTPQNRYHLLVTYPSVCIRKKLYLLDRTSGKHLFDALRGATEAVRLKYLVTDCFPSISGALKTWVPKIFNSVATYSTHGLRKYSVKWDSILGALTNVEMMKNLLQSTTFINHFLYCKLHLEWEVAMKVTRKTPKDNSMAVCFAYLGPGGTTKEAAVRGSEMAPVETELPVSLPSRRGHVPVEHAWLLPVLKPIAVDQRETRAKEPAERGTSLEARMKAVIQRIGKVGKRKKVQGEYATAYKRRIKALIPILEEVPKVKKEVPKVEREVGESVAAYEVFMKAKEPTSEQMTGGKSDLINTDAVGSKIPEKAVNGIPSRTTPVESKIIEETGDGIPTRMVPVEVNTAKKTTHEASSLTPGKAKPSEEVTYAMSPSMRPVEEMAGEQALHEGPTVQRGKSKLPEEVAFSITPSMTPVEMKMPSGEATAGSREAKKNKLEGGRAPEPPFNEREPGAGVIIAPGATTVRTRSARSKKPNLSKARVLDVEIPSRTEYSKPISKPAATKVPVEELSALRWDGLKLASTKPAVSEGTFLEVKEFSISTSPSNEVGSLQSTDASLTKSVPNKGVLSFGGFPIRFGGFPTSFGDVRKSFDRLPNWRDYVPNWVQGGYAGKKE